MSPARLYVPFKRAADVATAAGALVVLSPLLLLAALAIKLTSRGPLLFTQDRVGRGGRRFRVLKFRTMRGGRRPDPEELVPLNHPEITRVGRLLRRTKIDELPQLLNVLAGDMSIVGPRPTLSEQVEQYDDFERRRLEVRPGCTGLAQVNGNTALPWPERIKWDVFYVDHCSPWLDAWILLKTVAVIVAGERRFVRRFDDENQSQ
jgi:lipopolysaccharide/colanic/teichoic acid biosynthesis glycosyltransferase